jgi:hypothetical protein
MNIKSASHNCRSEAERRLGELIAAAATSALVRSILRVT